MRNDQSAPQNALRVILTAVGVALALYLIYLLRHPISWIILAGFLALAAAGPVNFLSRRMKRGFAIAITYLLIVAVPIGIVAAIAPGIVSQVEDLGSNAPDYAADVEQTVNESQTLTDLDQKFQLVAKLKKEAEKIPDRIPDAAAVLRDLGVGFINSIFAGITILVLSIFMVAAGPRWIHQFLAAQREEHAPRIERALRRIAEAVGNYVVGALAQATVAGLSAFVVLTILGIPFAAPLALLVAFFDLIPVIGAAIAGALVAIVTLFVDFPVATFVWAGFVIAYQQFENYVIQPQIQRRATKIEPFTVLVAVLFGSALFGVFGALLAIPTAASLQIAWHEWREYRRENAGGSKPATKRRSGGKAKPRPKRGASGARKRAASSKTKAQKTGKGTKRGAKGRTGPRSKAATA